MDDERFWLSVEKIEEEAAADLDMPRFRRRMKRKGFDASVIAEREEALRESYPQLRGVPSDGE